MTENQFYRQIIDQLDIDTLEYEIAEEWFVNLIGFLYTLCPNADIRIASEYVNEVWIKTKKHTIFDSFSNDILERDLDYPEEYPDHIEHY